MIGTYFFIIVYPLLLIVSLSAGKRVADYVSPRRPTWKPLGVENGLVGFYALLISFSLVQAGNNARERTGYIHDTSGKLALMLRKSKLYDLELQRRLYYHVSDILDVQLGGIQTSKAEVLQTVKKMEELDYKFDENMLKHVKANQANKQHVSELIADLEQMESNYFRLLYSYHRSTPILILFILILFSLFIGFLLGFLRGMLHTKMHISAIIFAVMSYIIIYAIQDLDDPVGGFIKPDFTEIQNIKRLYDDYFQSIK
jgi:hypothetical protein